MRGRGEGGGEGGWGYVAVYWIEGVLRPQQSYLVSMLLRAARSDPERPPSVHMTHSGLYNL